MAKAIVCQDLTRTYGQVKALNALNLEVDQGSVFGFLGRNGAGKTTTIRLLTGLAQPTKGYAWINGIAVSNADDRAKAQFGYLPEVPAFYSWMTPPEYLHYVGRLFNIGRRERNQRIDELLHFAGLHEKKKRRIGGFSKGMRQRLGLAQALINNPSVLFLDEPTSALDPAGRKNVLDMIDGLRGTTTIFLSSHILADIERVCDTIAIIHEGSLMLVSDRDELMSHYQSGSLELESEVFGTGVEDMFLSALQSKSWLTRVEPLGQIIRVTVSDPNQASEEMLKLIVMHNLTLSRYEWMRPTLEEVFIDISS